MDKISQAFLQLLAKKEYKQITVQEIMQTAHLPRTSFYNQYDSKLDLAQSILIEELPITFNYISHKFIDRQTDDRLTAAAFNNLAQHQHSIAQLWSISEIHPQLMDQLEHLFQKETLYIAKSRWPQAGQANLEFFANLFATAALKTMERYLNHPDQATAEQLAQQINTCMYDGIIKLVD